MRWSEPHDRRTVEDVPIESMKARAAPRPDAAEMYVGTRLAAIRRIKETAPARTPTCCRITSNALWNPETIGTPTARLSRFYGSRTDAAAAQGTWKEDDGEVDRDEVVMCEVMVDPLERTRWADYRKEAGTALRAAGANRAGAAK